jgi:hypothetical protein
MSRPKGMKPKSYTAHYYAHIESLDYRDGRIQLWIQCNHSGISRIYCADTVKLPFSDRERILLNLCDYHETASQRAIVVVDEGDKDRKDLESLIARLAAEGQKISIGYATAEMREQFEKGWQLKWLSAGKKLKVEGTEISTIEDYLRWKESQRGAAAPDDSSNS